MADVVERTAAIHTRRGDVTQPGITDGRTGVIIHCCNNRRAMGAGVAWAIADRFPKAKKTYLEGTMELGHATFCQVSECCWVANLIGQNGCGRDGRQYVQYDALRCAMKRVVEKFAATSTPIEIHCPRLGCGYAGGKWYHVAALLLEVFVACGIDVFVYNL